MLYGYIAALVMALVVAAGVLMLLGVSPGVALDGFLRGSVGTAEGLANTLNLATPIILTGLAVAVPFRARLLNIGGEGQFLVGALVATWFALSFPPVPVLGPMLALLAGALGGGAWAGIAALGKVRLQINEIVTTIVLNFLALFLLSWAINFPLRERGGFLPQTDPIPNAHQLPYVSPSFRAHVGFALAVLLALGTSYLLAKTRFGYRLRVASAGDELSRYLGVSRARTQFTALALGGFAAGLGGAAQVLGVQRRLFEGFSLGFGFDGIVAAFLGGGNPMGTAVSGLAIGALRAGGQNLQIFAQVPIATVVLFEAILILGTLSSRYLVQSSLSASRRLAAQAGGSG
jgi:simple sugar transport system permease protein